MVKKRIKKLLKTLRRGKKEVVKQISPEDMDAMPEDIQKERGYQHGEMLAMEEQIDELKAKLGKSREEHEVAKFLLQKEEEQRLKDLEGLVSLRSLFKELNSPLSKAKVELLSHDQLANFGNLYDISFDKDGKIGFWTLQDKIPHRIVAGSTLKNILWDYRGVKNQLRHGILTMALDEFGSPAENEMLEEVSNIIIDNNGKYNLSRVDRRRLISILVEKERTINQLLYYLGMAERALGKVGYEVNLSKLFAKLNNERRKTSDTLLIKFAKENNEVMKNYKVLESEVVEKSHQLSIKNSMVGTLEAVKDELIRKLGSMEKDTSVDTAKKEILNYMNATIGLLKGGKVAFAGTPEEEKAPLKRKYDEMVARKQQQESE